MSRILLLVGIVALAVMTGRATEPQPAPAPTAVAQHVAAPEAPPAAAYTCTSPSSCAVLAAALNGPTAQPQPRPSHRQPRASSTQRRSSGAQHEDQPGWNCATQGNHVCGDGVAGGPTANGGCPAGGTRVYGTPHGCRYR